MKRLVALLALCLIAPPREAEACAPAPPDGGHVAISSEEALIAWDPATQTEHFIRRGVFRTDSRDFGFLVPTPSVPELAEAPDAVFGRLSALLEPRRIEETEYLPMTCLMMPFTFALGRASAPAQMVSMEAPPVDVLGTQRVAGLDATILAATDAQALSAWLTEHGYATRPELTDWLRPYVALGYTITAFKIARDEPGEGDVGSRALRISFRTPRPFYPYREPSDAIDVPGRRLRLFLVANERVEPKLGELRRDIRTTSTLLARGIDAEERGRVFAGIPVASSAQHLTVIDDVATLRESDDLFFERAPEQSDVEIPPIVTIHEQIVPVPIELLLPVGLWLVFRRHRRKRSSLP